MTRKGRYQKTTTTKKTFLTLQGHIYFNASMSRFMDKLGLSAALGIQVLMQHTLVGINGLLEKDLEPLPVS